MAANIVSILESGSQLVLVYDDQTHKFAYPTTGGLWVITGDPGPSGGGGGPVTPGDYSVIFPCAEHRVSDSFTDHQDRGSVNPGTDYIAGYGSQVWSVADGTVTNVDTSNDGSGGRMVHIDHDDGTGADYLHLSTIETSVGTHVSQGDPIAHSGASGFDSDHGYGAHLHISYRTVPGHAYTNFNSIDFDALVRSLGLT